MIAACIHCIQYVLLAIERVGDFYCDDGNCVVCYGIVEKITETRLQCERKNIYSDKMLLNQYSNRNTNSNIYSIRKSKFHYYCENCIKMC